MQLPKRFDAILRRATQGRRPLPEERAYLLSFDGGHYLVENDRQKGA